MALLLELGRPLLRLLLRLELLLLHCCRSLLCGQIPKGGNRGSADPDKRVDQGGGVGALRPNRGRISQQPESAGQNAPSYSTAHDRPLSARASVGKWAPWPARAFLTERLHASETGFDFLITGVLVYGQDGATITTDVLDLHLFLLPRQRSGIAGDWIAFKTPSPWRPHPLGPVPGDSESGALFSAICRCVTALWLAHIAAIRAPYSIDWGSPAALPATLCDRAVSRSRP